jgi:uncharacterized membrane protein
MKTIPIVTILNGINRFFLRQAFVPLVLASFLCLGLFLMRVGYSNRFLEYRNLIWNLALAWIPYSASVAVAALKISFPRWWYLTLPVPGLIWLLFFPNAPYLVTDFLHLQARPPVPLWYDIGLVSCFAFTGCLLAIVSLHTMHSIVEEKFGWLVGWMFAFTTLPLCGLGIYLGRFGRFNSWDFLFNPKEIMKEIARPILDPLDNLRFIGFTLMFTAILVVFYLAFTALSDRKQTH